MDDDMTRMIRMMIITMAIDDDGDKYDEEDDRENGEDDESSEDKHVEDDNADEIITMWTKTMMGTSIIRMMIMTLTRSMATMTGAIKGTITSLRILRTMAR